MRAALLIVLLMGCTDWNHLVCDIRRACDGGDADGGISPLDPLVIASFNDSSGTAITDFTVGTNSWALATGGGLYYSVDGGQPSMANLGPHVSRIDALANGTGPSRYWTVADNDAGTLFTWDETQGPGSATSVEQMDASVHASVTAYIDSNQVVVAAFGTVNGEITAQGYRPDTSYIGGASLVCDLRFIDSASIDDDSTGLVAGITSSCAGIAPGYAVAFFPSGSAVANTQSLLGDNAANKVVVGSSGGVGVIAMDTDMGIYAILAHNNALLGTAPKQALKIIPAGVRGFLDDAVMTDSTTRFLIAVTNHEAADALVGGYTVPAGRSAVFALSDEGGQVFQILQAWLLNTGEGGPLTDVMLKLNPTRQRAWLAATRGSGRVIFQLPDELNTP